MGISELAFKSHSVQFNIVIMIVLCGKHPLRINLTQQLEARPISKHGECLDDCLLMGVHKQLPGFQYSLSNIQLKISLRKVIKHKFLRNVSTFHLKSMPN